MTRHSRTLLLLAGVVLLTAALFAGCKTAPRMPDEKPSGISPEMPVSVQEPLANVKNTAQLTSDVSASSIIDEELTFPGTVRLPKDSIAFWSEVMTADTIAAYKAQGYRTFCNRFVGDTLVKYFGREVFSKIFPNGVLDPNVMHREWQSNPNLIALGPDRYHILDIQGLANKGYLVLLSYIWTWGHLAFVGNEKLKIHTVPPSPLIEGNKGTEMDENWLPVVVQAGTYTGVTSAGFASNGWIDGPGFPLFKDGSVRFYLVKQ